MRVLLFVVRVVTLLLIPAATVLVGVVGIVAGATIASKAGPVFEPLGPLFGIAGAPGGFLGALLLRKRMIGLLEARLPADPKPSPFTEAVFRWRLRWEGGIFMAVLLLIAGALAVTQSGWVQLASIAASPMLIAHAVVEWKAAAESWPSDKKDSAVGAIWWWLIRAVFWCLVVLVP